MDAIELLTTRYSCGKLTEPGPSTEQIDTLLGVGLRAPDHGGLKPWHFVVATGDGRVRLGELFAQAVTNNGGDDAKIEKARDMPLRAPCVIVVIAKYTEHAKVPWIEQVQSAGCALFSMQQTALAMGYGGIWRTGDLARDETVRENLMLDTKDELVGFLYVGTEPVQHNCRKPIEPGQNVEYWR